MFHSFPAATGYCWQPGWNPAFVAPPIVTQMNITMVRVSWRNIVKNEECVDQFLVKYWKTGRPTDYKKTDLVGTSIDAVLLTGIIPNVEYDYQVIAREDKLMGIDYNRSPTTKYTTSRNKLPTKNEILKDANVLNAVNVDTHKPDEKYNPTSKIIEKKTYHSSSSDQNFHVNKVNQGGSLSLEKRGKGDSKGNEEGNDVIWIMVITAAAMTGLIIVTGIIYNCVKRQKRRNQSVESQMEDSESYQTRTDLTTNANH
jgi:hypothetical protein